MTETQTAPSTAPPPRIPADPEHAAYQKSHIDYWQRIASEMRKWRGLGDYYHRRLAEVFGLIVPPGLRVLELGSGTGDLLAALEPSRGVGIDFAPAMLDKARAAHPDLEFHPADAHSFEIDGPFDAVILSDLVNELWDVQAVLERVEKLCHPGTRILINTYSRLWEWPLAAAGASKLARPRLKQNWLTVDDLGNLLELSGLELMRTSQEVLWPVRTPMIDSLFNKFLVRLWPIRHLALTNLVVARPKGRPIEREPIVSVVVPARNEAGNIPQIVRRTPDMGAGTELIFVEGGSSDDTWQAIQHAVAADTTGRMKCMQQTGKGKGDAVRLGYAHATGEVLMILDADMTVPPEDLPRFYQALRDGHGEFINGVRLVYPMQDQAMRLFNLLGNKFFSATFSWLLGQPIKDTLCGTKVMWKRDYEKLAANRHYFGDFDPFGDFDLLFGAAKLNLKIIDLPIRYRARTYGDTNIDRWRHGWQLIKMAWFAAGRIKFV